MVSADSHLIIQRGIDETFLTFADSQLLDENLIKQIEQEITGIINEENQKNMLLDFSRVEFMSSSFLGLLVKIHKRISEKNGQLKLCNINKKIREIFKITRLDKIFQIDEH